MKKGLFVGIILAIISTNIYAQTGCWHKISAGFEHNLAIRGDGTLWAWGDNQYGQIGDGTNTIKDVPTQIGTDNNWADVSAGLFFSIARKTDGTLWAWGNNEFGQLSNNTTINTNSPAQIGTDVDWAKISAGGYHLVALKNNGSLWACGRNGVSGILGNGTSTNASNIIQIGVETDWKQIYAGTGHTFAIKNDGTLWSWGNNSDGQLGNGTYQVSSTPQQITAFTDWKTVASGQYHTLAIRENGAMYSWGHGGAGELGNGTYTGRSTVEQIGVSLDWNAVATGYIYNSYAIKNDGSLWAWGDNYYGQFGTGNFNGANVPVQIGGDQDWQSVLAGDKHSAYLKNDGTLWLCGSNDKGQLGTGSAASLNAIPLVINCPENFSIKENYNDIEILLYPNPTDQILYIQTSAQIQQVLIINNLGQVIKSFTSTSTDVSELPQGIYYLKTLTEKGIGVKSFIKN